MATVTTLLVLMVAVEHMAFMVLEMCLRRCRWRLRLPSRLLVGAKANQLSSLSAH
jgi:uncharacterized membrane protein